MDTIRHTASCRHNIEHHRHLRRASDQGASHVYTSCSPACIQNCSNCTCNIYNTHSIACTAAHSNSYYIYTKQQRAVWGSLSWWRITALALKPTPHLQIESSNLAITSSRTVVKLLKRVPRAAHDQAAR